MSVNVYRNGRVYVRAQACDHCLLSSRRLVDAERARALVRATRDGEASSFVCHRSQTDGESEAICRSWWNGFADENWVLRFAQAEGIVEFVAGDNCGERGASGGERL